MLKCTEDDFETVYGPCINGQRNVTNILKIPSVCDLNNTIVPVPANKIEKCDSCNQGSSLVIDSSNNEEKCAFCPDGS